jgi:hypothetical protein
VTSSDNQARYRIVRFYQQGARKVLKTNLTLEEAQAHCRDPETSSSTCQGEAGQDHNHALRRVVRRI